MARGVPGFVRIGAALAGCALVAACTPDPAPPATPSPTPPASTSATPSATPTETDIERRQRLDFEAAEKAYRSAVAETERLARAGGTQEPSDKLKAVATGDYLETALFTLRTIRKQEWRLAGSLSVLGVKRAGGWTRDSLSLIACEDNSSWKLLDKTGKDVTPSDLTDYLQSVTVSKTEDGWKTSMVRTKKVPSVSPRDCAAQ